MPHAAYVFLRTGLSLCIVALLMLHASGYRTFPLLTQLEQFAYDARLRLTLPGEVDRRIVIVDIDESSLLREGQWPWPRQRVAQMVDTLFSHYQVRLLGFDMVFADSPHQPALRELDKLAQGALRDNVGFQQQYAQLRPQFADDALLAASLRDRAVVSGYYFSLPEQQGSELAVGKLPTAAAPVSALRKAPNPFAQATGYSANLAELQDSAISGGFFNSTLVDSDGLFRRLPLLMTYEDQLYEHFSLAVVRRLLGNPPLEILSASGYSKGDAVSDQRVEAIRVGAFDIPVDAQGAALIPYRGAQGSFPYVSASKILAREADPALLSGAIVLIGSTAAGLMDLRATPVQNIYPGVEINANLIAGILDQRIKYRPAYTTGLELALLAVIGLISTALGWLPPLRALLSTLALAAALLGLNLYAWQALHQVIPLAQSLTLLLLLYLLHSSYGYFVQTRRELRLSRLFGHYVPPKLVAEMSRRPGSYALGGESRDMTVLFSDLQDFTTLSETLQPHQLTQLMQFILTPLTCIIHDQRGTVDKYIGDAIMAFWGAPLTDTEHARHAVLAALKMKARLADLAPELLAHGWPVLRIRIGINSGMMNVGNMGSEFRMAYTVLGDAVNLASRLEGAAKHYGATIVISESTRAAVPEIACRELDRVRVKGRSQPVTLFEPLCPLTALTEAQRRELTDHDSALAHYRRQEWARAQAGFHRLEAEWPEQPVYTLYLKRIAALLAAPPDATWDGVFTFTDK
ncbi:MAG: adenylate/guanylate cyclase domain-containing protein [Gammaproteobacteria bacterium]|nr:adenylate/guanylate cyclase domain-containing protein [Gammaproteobacteria bacterium]MBU0787216.1 adenylate/guanylate cyclase domain-containing protein [Gammaproteobacteria bacterium]MBU0814223.1 adenylate/guanylate cyclase domain-containing protein [Gammaproteobacteria bacterium]MBU1786257.1 adenylate/guanylate cyclase domain-containing protein [Gammaproteobacteria bacterium]